MTRILAVGDQHLGKGRDLGRTPDERLAEQQQLWETILELSRQRRCDVVAHCGDMFDRHWFSDPDVLLAAERPLVNHQVQGGAPVVMLQGNHDIPSQQGGCSLDVLDEAGLVELAREPRVIPVGDVKLCCLPWTPVARIVAADNGRLDRAEIHAHAADLIVQVARDLFTGEGREILLGHFSVTDTVLPTGLDVATLGGVVLPMDDLQAIGYERLLFSHIHSPQVVGRFLYTGSPQQLDHGDCGSDRGVWILDDGQEPEFVALPSRRFVTLDVDRDHYALNDEGMRAIVDAFVKVRYTVTEDEARRIDQSEMRQQMEGWGAYSVTFDVTVERARRDRGALLTDGQTRGEQLAAYLAAVGVNGDVGARMLAQAGKYLDGVAS